MYGVWPVFGGDHIALKSRCSGMVLQTMIDGVWCYVWSFESLNTVVVAGTKVNELIVLLALMQLFI